MRPARWFRPSGSPRSSVGFVRKREFRRSDCAIIRHTYATLALKAGVHVKVVSERLGHSSIAITLDLYSHVTPGIARDAADQVAAAIFGD